MFSRTQLYPAFAFVGALALLLPLAAQYPLQTTFPMGGDAAAYSHAAKTLLAFPQEPLAAWHTLSRSNYPLAQVIYTLSALVPVSWPERFVIMITLAHVAAGAALSLLLYRLGHWPTAAAGLAIWGLTSITINNHLEDGTLAQLLSLVFLLLTLERSLRASSFLTLVFLIATYLTHPLSALIAVPTLVLGTMPEWLHNRSLTARKQKFLRIITLALCILAILFLIQALRGFTWPQLALEPQPDIIIDLLRSKFSFWMALSLSGFLLLRSPLALSFAALALLLATNSHLGIGLAENRFRTYLITAIVILSAIAMPQLLTNAFRASFVRTLFVVILFGSYAALTWRDNSSVYAYYENPANNARLIPAAREAIEWAGDRLPEGSHIATTAASRHSEWIPVLTDHTWTELNAQHPLLTTQREELQRVIAEAPFTHVMFFVDREEVLESLNDAQRFPVLYQNPAAVIMQLP
ncbi:MAG TPA: hypothetical protein VJC05_00375 [Candidatus Andersenbacteria bacterium]|nr:hypothetical protein [Candidatus Andersenbacteria bacterium]